MATDNVSSNITVSSRLNQETFSSPPTYLIVDIASRQIQGTSNQPQSNYGGSWGDPSKTEFKLYSSLNLPSGCLPHNPMSIEYVPAELVDSNLLMTFPKPYTLDVMN